MKISMCILVLLVCFSLISATNWVSRRNHYRVEICNKNLVKGLEECACYCKKWSHNGEYVKRKCKNFGSRLRRINCITCRHKYQCRRQEEDPNL